MKISDLMKFCEKSMTLFKKILDDVNIYQENYTTYPEEILLAIVHFVDMIVNRGLSATNFLTFTMLLLPTFLSLIGPIALFHYKLRGKKIFQ